MGSGGWKRVALDSNKEMFVQKKDFWFVKMGIFCGQRRKVRAKEVFVRKKAALREVRKVSANENFLIRDKGIFSTHAKQSDNEKTHFSTAKLQLPTAPKLTSSCKFPLRKPTVSLQYNNPFSKNISLASALR